MKNGDEREVINSDNELKDSKKGKKNSRIRGNESDFLKCLEREK